VDNCSSITTMFPSLASFCIVSTSTKCYFTVSSSSNSSINIGSIDVTPGLVLSCMPTSFAFAQKNQLQMF
jgi:hypothetical protein